MNPGQKTLTVLVTVIYVTPFTDKCACVCDDNMLWIVMKITNDDPFT